jgi:hypothetical protein
MLLEARIEDSNGVTVEPVLGAPAALSVAKNGPPVVRKVRAAKILLTVMFRNHFFVFRDKIYFFPLNKNVFFAFKTIDYMKGVLIFLFII